MTRTFRAGEEVEDLCRACKTDRLHTVIVVDGSGWPLRVQCDYCQSQHNYRGGPRLATAGRPDSSVGTSAKAEGLQPRESHPTSRASAPSSSSSAPALA